MQVSKNILKGHSIVRAKKNMITMRRKLNLHSSSILNILHEWFNNPKSIAKYEIIKVRGPLCTIVSSNSESLHSSNESFMPATPWGIMTPDNHMHELTKRNNEWIHRDLTAKSKYNLSRASGVENMPDSSMQNVY